jgi:hypothetical protein
LMLKVAIFIGRQYLSVSRRVRLGGTRTPTPRPRIRCAPLNFRKTIREHFPAGVFR